MSVTTSVMELIDIRGRCALITGGAGHIGSTMADALAELGANIVVLDLTADACKKTCAQLERKYEISALPLAIDLAQEAEILGVAQTVEKQFGRLDILINTAALVGTSELDGWATPFASQSVETWRLAMEINLTSVFALVQSCTELLKRSGSGSIINLASIYGMVGPNPVLYESTGVGATPAAYAASKGGLLQLTRWLATMLAPEIRVNAITPGGVRRGQPTKFQQQYVARSPLGRMATETDLKGAAVYLASDLSSYVTGHNLVVDGGWTIW